MRKFSMVAGLGALTLSIGCGNGDNGRTTMSLNNSTSAGTGGQSTSATGARTMAGASSVGGASASTNAGAGTNATGAAAGAGGSGNIGADTTSTGGVTFSTNGTGRVGGATSTSSNIGAGGSASSSGGNVASGGNANVGGSAPSTGGASVNAGGTVGVGGSTSDCNYPICLTNLLSVCPMSIDPLPTCIYQDTITGNIEQSNACYSDGQSASTTIDLTTSQMTMTFKRNGAVCYSIETSATMSTAGVPTSSHTTYRDASGNIVATEDLDTSPRVDTVTCTGEQPVVLNSSCSDGPWWDLKCQEGVCNP